MHKKKMSKSSKRSLVVLGTISLVVIGIFIYNLFSYGYSIYKLKMQENELATQLTDLEHNEKLLKTEIEKLKDSDYIARYARENYQYSKDGEIILELNKDKNKVEEQTKTNFSYDNIIKIGVCFIFLILVYVIIKNKSSKKNKRNKKK